MHGIFWPEKNSKERLWEACRKMAIDKHTVRQKWSWVSHEISSGYDHPGQAQSRPSKADLVVCTVAADMKIIRLTWPKVKCIAQDETR